MPDTEAKYHHLIPQTYMSAWANTSGTLDVEFLNRPGTVVPRNKENIAGINDYHSIRAGMPICSASDAATIFTPVAGYVVECNGKQLTTPLELNNHFGNFDSWTITRSDGTPVSKKRIKNDIEQIKIKDIESNWSVKYENVWNQVIAKIEAAVLSAPNGSIPAFDREYLMRFYTALDWRGFSSNQNFEDTYQNLVRNLLDDKEIPRDERILPSLKTTSDEMRHYLLLNYYRKYLNDTGVIYDDAMANLAHTSFHFLVSDGQNKFITCDSPAFTYKRPDGQLEGLFPITPRILMAKGKCTEDIDKFWVTHISDDAVSRYNNAIRMNATSFVIFPS